MKINSIYILNDTKNSINTKYNGSLVIITNIKSEYIYYRYLTGILKGRTNKRFLKIFNERFISIGKSTIIKELYL